MRSFPNSPDAENSYLAGDAVKGGPLGQLLGHSITYRIAAGPHAGVAARTHEREKLERLCRYIARPAVSEKRLSLLSNGHVRYELKTPYRDGASRLETPQATGRGLCSPFAACFRGGATIFLPSPELRSSPSQNRTSGFPNIRLPSRSFSEPPLYDRDSGLCGYAV